MVEGGGVRSGWVTLAPFSVFRQRQSQSLPFCCCNMSKDTEHHWSKTLKLDLPGNKQQVNKYFFLLQYRNDQIYCHWLTQPFTAWSKGLALGGGGLCLVHVCAQAVAPHSWSAPELCGKRWQRRWCRGSLCCRRSLEQRASGEQHFHSLPDPLY